MADLDWQRLAVASEPPTSRRIEAARRANGHLLALAERLHEKEREKHLVGFLCECGCQDTAALTAAEYQAQGGAWCAGHIRPHNSAASG